MIKIKKILCFFLFLFIITGCSTTENITEGNNKKYVGYYEAMNNNLDLTFRETLHNLLEETHQINTYKEAWTILKEADAYDDTYIKCFYTGCLILKSSQDNGTISTTLNPLWNREHIWPNSYGFHNQKNDPAYTDCFNLHATEKNINQIRGNKYFDYVSLGTTDDYQNKWTTTTFEVRDEIKGDVARSLFYMVVRYDCDLLDLELVDDTSKISSDSPYMGNLTTLIKWAEFDPVSEEEIRRNEIVYQYQKNRNPFIDNPEFIYYLYREECTNIGFTVNNF